MSRTTLYPRFKRKYANEAEVLLAYRRGVAFDRSPTGLSRNVVDGFTPANRKPGELFQVRLKRGVFVNLPNGLYV